MNFIAIFAAIASRLILYLLTANWASIIHHFLVCQDSLDKTWKLVELRFWLLRSSIVVPGLVLKLSHIFSYTFNDLLDQFKVVWSLNLRVRATVIRLSYCCDRTGILNLFGICSSVPLAQIFTSLIARRIEEDLTVFITSIEWFATVIRNTSSFNCEYFSLTKIKLCGILSPKC